MKKYRVHIITNTGYHTVKEISVNDPGEIREKLHLQFDTTIWPVLISDKKTYREKKEEVRKEAIEWQLDFSENNYSYGELFYYQDYFEKKGRRYGLLKEFRENGIC